MSENKNDMSFADKIARVNRHNMQAVADAHNNLLKRVEVLEQENKEQEDNIKRLGERLKVLIEKKQSEESEQKNEFVQIGGQKLRISPYKAESEIVSWKDFEDFLDDNAEDFESINKRFDALENQMGNMFRDADTESDMLAEWQSAMEDNIKRLEERLKTIEEKIEGYVFE